MTTCDWTAYYWPSYRGCVLRARRLRRGADQRRQFVGLATKTDALYYFALTTLTMVGFGDVHAAGQLARALVIVQLLFNVVVLASAARVLSRGIAARTRTGRQRR